MPHLSEHARAQLLRFARWTILAAVTEYVQAGGNLPMTWSTLWVLAPGIAETVLRQVRKVQSAPADAPPTLGAPAS